MRIFKVTDRVRFIWDAPMYDMPGINVRIFCFRLQYSFKGQVQTWCGKFVVGIGRYSYSPKEGLKRL